MNIDRIPLLVRGLLALAMFTTLPMAAETARLRCAYTSDWGFSYGYATPKSHPDDPFVMSGTSIETPFTKVKKFVTTATHEQIATACRNAKSVMKEDVFPDRFAFAQCSDGEWRIIVTREGIEYRNETANRYDGEPKATTSVACYFGKPEGPYRWYWALAPDNSWFVLPGSWSTMGRSVFLTGMSREQIVTACMKAQTFHGVQWDLIGAFAANSSLEPNRQIVSGETPLFPVY